MFNAEVIIRTKELYKYNYDYSYASYIIGFIDVQEAPLRFIMTQNLKIPRSQRFFFPSSLFGNKGTESTFFLSPFKHYHLSFSYSSLTRLNSFYLPQNRRFWVIRIFRLLRHPFFVLLSRSFLGGLETLQGRHHCGAEVLCFVLCMAEMYSEGRKGTFALKVWRVKNSVTSGRPDPSHCIATIQKINK